VEENYNGKFYNKSIKSKILKLLKNLDVEAGNFKDLLIRKETMMTVGCQ